MITERRTARCPWVPLSEGGVDLTQVFVLLELKPTESEVAPIPWTRRYAA